jgi:hypothetical protein
MESSYSYSTCDSKHYDARNPHMEYHNGPPYPPPHPHQQFPYPPPHPHQQFPYPPPHPHHQYPFNSQLQYPHEQPKAAKTGDEVTASLHLATELNVSSLNGPMTPHQRVHPPSTMEGIAHPPSTVEGIVNPPSLINKSVHPFSVLTNHVPDAIEEAESPKPDTKNTGKKGSTPNNWLQLTRPLSLKIVNPKK